MLDQANAAAQNAHMPRNNVKHRIGDRFGRLTLLKYVGGSAEGMPPTWLCQCDCGTTKKISASAMGQGLTRSCGCLNKGDYPPLDIGEKSFYRWLRQAGVALGVFAVFLIVDPPPMARAVVPIDDTIFVLLSKNVIINDATVKPERGMSADYVAQFSYNKIGAHAFQWGVDLIPGGKDDLCRREINGNEGGWGQEVGRQKYVSVDFFDNGGGLSIIFESVSDSEREAGSSVMAEMTIAVQFWELVREVLTENLYMDMSPFGLDQSIGSCFSGFGRYARGTGKADCKNTQNKGEHCNYDGRDSNHFLVKDMHKVSSVMQPDYNRSVRGGAVVMFGLIGLLWFAVWFWWLITRPGTNHQK